MKQEKYTVTNLQFWATLMLAVQSLAVPTYLNCSTFIEGVENQSKNESFFWDGILHACFDTNPYDVRELPVRPGKIYKPFKILYSVSLEELHEVKENGHVTMLAFFWFEWQDAYRVWNLNEIPIPLLSVPIYEGWHPVFMLRDTPCDSIYMSADLASFAEIHSDGSVAWRW